MHCAMPCRWYAANAHKVWCAAEMPSVADLINHSKGLRTIKQVRENSKKLRANAKAREEGAQQQVRAVLCSRFQPHVRPTPRRAWVPQCAACLV